MNPPVIPHITDPLAQVIARCDPAMPGTSDNALPEGTAPQNIPAFNACIHAPGQRNDSQSSLRVDACSPTGSSSCSYSRHTISSLSSNPANAVFSKDVSRQDSFGSVSNDFSFRGGDTKVFEKLRRSLSQLEKTSIHSDSSLSCSTSPAKMPELDKSNSRSSFHFDAACLPALPEQDSLGNIPTRQSSVGSEIFARTPCFDADARPVYRGHRHSICFTSVEESAHAKRLKHRNRCLSRNPVITAAITKVESESITKFNQYSLQNEIGKGSYGICQLVYNEDDETHYAMKILSKRKLKRSLMGRHPRLRKGPSARGPHKSTGDCPSKPRQKTPIEKVYQEIALLKSLAHPNLVKLIEVLDDENDDSLCMVFELMEFGEVLPLNNEGTAPMPLTEPSARRYFIDCLYGLEYLHARGIIHRDLKPSNILLDVNRHAKIADLGVSEEINDKVKRIVRGSAGTPAFMAPETLMISTNPCYDGAALDIWALGVTLYCFVFGEVPFTDEHTLALYDKILTKKLKLDEMAAKFSVSLNCCDLITRMLDKEPTTRIKIAEIRDHSWLKLTFDRENSANAEIWKDEEENDLLPCQLMSQKDNIGECDTITDNDVRTAVRTLPNITTLVRIKGMLRRRKMIHRKQSSFHPSLTSQQEESRQRPVQRSNTRAGLTIYEDTPGSQQ